ncbi:hypothetical protein Tco_0038032 [Tanacetum coccineum]
MEELCQPTINGRGRPIAPVNIQATDFRLKNYMIQQVQQSCQYHGLPGDDANKHIDKFLTMTQSMMQNKVPHDMGRDGYQVSIEILPPSRVTNLRNDISNFRQLPDESLFEAWEHTFYNGLTLRHHDTINAAAGGTFMKRRPEKCYDLIENMTAHHNDWDTSAQKGESSRLITSSSSEIASLAKPPVASLNGTYMLLQETTMREGALPRNTIPNPREDIKVITTRSGITLARPSVPSPNSSSSSKEVEREPKKTIDQVHILSSGSTARVLSLIIQPTPASKSIEIPERNPHQPPLPYPSRLNKEKL